MKRLWPLLGRVLYRVALVVFRVVPLRASRVRCLVNSGEGVLLVRNWLGSQRWTLPGGGLHRGEKPEHAAARELAEELGLQVEAADIKSLGQTTNSEDGLHYPIELCAIHLPDKVSPKPNFEIVDAQWFKRDNLPEDHSPIVSEVLHRKP